MCKTDATHVNKVVISPIGYHVVYTVDGEAPFETLYAENGEEFRRKRPPTCQRDQHMGRIFRKTAYH
ncbi:MAG: hypothetical protein V8Q23_05490 [Eubacteriales bacterium]